MDPGRAGQVTLPGSPGAGPSTGTRLGSIDALRGFDMLWIAGGDAVVEALRDRTGWPVLATIGGQLDHAAWRGFRFEDLIFPLFVFLAGVSLPWSLARAAESGGRARAVRRMLRRGAVLFLLGVFFYGGFSARWPEIRVLGVLQRIALCTMAAGLLVLWLPPRRVALVAAAILVGYWAALAVANRAADVHPAFAEGENLTNWVDARWLPGKKYDGDHDPEGILSTLPAVVTCLLGYFAGLLIRRTDLTPSATCLHLAAWGLAALGLGLLWGTQFPVIKKLWTSSYVLVAGGWSLLLLAAFHWMVEVRGWTRWTLPFIWIGANSLAVYLFPALVDLGSLSARLVGGDIAHALGSFAPLVAALVQVGVLVAFARFLFRRNIFLRV